MKAAQADPSVAAYKALSDIYMATAKLNGLIVDKSKVEAEVSGQHKLMLEADAMDPKTVAEIESMIKAA